MLEEGIIEHELPEVINPRSVIYYSSFTKQVKGNVKSKAKKILELGLIEDFSDVDLFYVNPIKGYNKTKYTISRNGIGYECNCQGCQSKMRKGEYDPQTEEKAACSHILAIYYWLKIKNWNKEDETLQRLDELGKF